MYYSIKCLWVAVGSCALKCHFFCSSSAGRWCKSLCMLIVFIIYGGSRWTLGLHQSQSGVSRCAETSIVNLVIQSFVVDHTDFCWVLWFVIGWWRFWSKSRSPHVTCDAKRGDSRLSLPTIVTWNRMFVFTIYLDLPSYIRLFIHKSTFVPEITMFRVILRVFDLY